MPAYIPFSWHRATIRTQVTAVAALLLASACRSNSPMAPSSVTPIEGAAIAVVSGNNQQGKAGEVLADPLVVRVTDANGNGVSGAAVAFQIASGAGDLGGSCYRSDPTTVRSSQTDQDGIAKMIVQPIVLGRTTVVARCRTSRRVGDVHGRGDHPCR